MPVSYTISLQEIIESKNINIFDFDYEVEEPYTKELLEQAFIDKYYLRDIAHETVSIFKFRLKTLWKRRIKHYNEIFKVYNDHKFEPLISRMRKEKEEIGRVGTEDKTTDETEGVTTKTDDSQTSTTVGEGSRTLGSETKLKDTPQTQWVDDGYLTGIQKDDSTEETDTSETVTFIQDGEVTLDKVKSLIANKGYGEDVLRTLDVESRDVTDVKLFKEYIELKVDLLDLFLSEFNHLFFGLF